MESQSIKRLKTTPIEVQPRRRQHESIALQPAEQLLCELLIACRTELQSGIGPVELGFKPAKQDAQAQDSASPDPPHLDLTDAVSRLKIWITGGWVRDRLLGLVSHDIDIALSTCTGAQFASAVTQHLGRNVDLYRSRAKALGLNPGIVRPTHFQTTKQNPVKSKHLETAVGVIFGLDLDLVNLRKEVYDPNSRTPEMEFGTAEEDALRRDATVNAMFFDVDACRVVDLTGRGMEDMEQGIMRTPLEPEQTFLDDPLRVLRLVRMCAKLGYTLDPAAQRCMARRPIHQALHAKISRERVGTEAWKMMQGPHPRIAFRLLHECGLWASVFLTLDSASLMALRERLPESRQEVGRAEQYGVQNQVDNVPDRVAPWPPTWPRTYDLLTALLDYPETGGRVGELVRAEARAGGDLHLIWMAAGFAPLAPLAAVMGKGRVQQAVDDATNALKLTLQQTRLLASALHSLDDVRAAVNSVARQSDKAPSRGEVGMRLRAWGKTWRVQVMYSLLAEVVCAKQRDDGAEDRAKDQGEGANEGADDDDDGDVFTPHVRRYSAFLDFVSHMRLEGAPDAKPLLDGREIMALFDAKSGGPWLKSALSLLTKWQFDNEDKASKEAATSWLAAQRERLEDL